MLRYHLFIYVEMLESARDKILARPPQNLDEMMVVIDNSISGLRRLKPNLEMVEVLD